MRGHDLDEGDAARERERRGGLELSLRDGLEAGPEDLRQVRAVVDGERDDQGHEGREPDADHGQPQVDQEDLDEPRRVPDDVHVAGGQPPEGRHPGHPGDRREEAHERAAEARAHRDQQGQREPGGEDLRVLEEDRHPSS